MKKVLFLILLSVALSVTGQLLLKIGVDKISGKANPVSFALLLARAYKSPFIIGGLSLYGFSAVAWIYILSKVNLSFAYPFLALNYVGIIFVSRMFLNESLDLLKLTGSGVIIIGIIIISRSYFIK